MSMVKFFVTLVVLALLGCLSQVEASQTKRLDPVSETVKHGTNSFDINKQKTLTY